MSDHGSHRLNRRRLLGSFGFIGAALVLTTACGQTPAAQPTAAQSTAGQSTAGQPTAATGSSGAVAPKATAAPQSSGPSKVSFTSQGNKDELAMFDRILDEFEKANPSIKMDRKYDTSLSWPKVINELRTGTASDVMRTNDDDIFLLLSADVITSLDDYVHHDLKMDDYFDVAFKTRVGPGGEIGSALVGTAPTVMFYNVDLFQKAGVKPPTDWVNDNWSLDDLEQAMQKLTKKTNGRVDVYGWAEPYWWPEVGLWDEGVPYYNDDQTKAVLATPEGIAFMDRYKKWYTEGWAAPPNENATQLFNSGLIAMTYQDMGFTSSIKGGVKWDIGPTAKGKVHATTFHNDRNFTIPKSSTKKDDSWQVLKFLLSQSEDGKTGGQAEFARADWGVPVLRAAAEGPLFNDSSRPPASRKVFAQGAGNGWPIIDNPAGEELQVIFRDIDSLRTGKQSGEEFLKAGEDALNRVLKQTGWNGKDNVRGWRVKGILEQTGLVKQQ